MEQTLKNRLKELADKYETVDFLKNDPSKFMHQISDFDNQEIVAFLSANLAFGRRDQILSHIQKILDNTGNDIKTWVLSEKYKSFFPQNDKSFYRTYSNNSMISFFETIKNIILETNQITNLKDKGDFGKFGLFFQNKYVESKNNGIDYKKSLHKLIAAQFPKSCTLLPHTDDSAAKKVNMFLRWMVRNNSPVDLGLWTWYEKKDLLIPLDTHVMQEATNFGLLQPNKNGKVKSANLKTALELTEKISEAFPNDPCRGDFALFGLGVDVKN